MSAEKEAGEVLTEKKYLKFIIVALPIVGLLYTVLMTVVIGSDPSQTLPPLFMGMPGRS